MLIASTNFRLNLHTHIRKLECFKSVDNFNCYSGLDYKRDSKYKFLSRCTLDVILDNKFRSKFTHFFVTFYNCR
jgi:hypothetical protein